MPGTGFVGICGSGKFRETIRVTRAQELSLTCGLEQTSDVGLDGDNSMTTNPSSSLEIITQTYKLVGYSLGLDPQADFHSRGCLEHWILLPQFPSEHHHLRIIV